MPVKQISKIPMKTFGFYLFLLKVVSTFFHSNVQHKYTWTPYLHFQIKQMINPMYFCFSKEIQIQNQNETFHKTGRKKNNPSALKFFRLFVFWPSKHHVSILSWDQAPLLPTSLLFSLSITAALLPLALMLNCSCVIVSSGSPFPFSWVTDMTFRYTDWQLLSPRNWIISFLCQQSRG